MSSKIKAGAPLVRRFLVLLAVILVYRLGASIPAPGVTRDLQALTPSHDAPVDLFNLFSGGPLTQISLFSLGVTPFITASIAMQLLGSIVPAIKEARRQGSIGTKKINSISRIVAVTLGAIQAASTAYALNSRGLFPDLSPVNVALFTISATVGFLVLLWLAELITRHGVGSGVTVLLLVSILSRVWETSSSFAEVNGTLKLVLVLLVTILLSALIALFTRADRRVPIVHASSSVDTRLGHLSYLPFKVLHAGVAPIIFASSLVAMLHSGVSLIGWDSAAAALSDHTSVAFMALTAIMVVGFARLYERTSADPVDMANDLMRDSNYIPGVRPGWATAHLVENVSLRLAAFACVVIVPLALMSSLGDLWFSFAFLPLAGTSLLIVNSAILDTARQASSVSTLYAYDEIGR